MQFEALATDEAARMEFLRDKSIGGTDIGKLLGLSKWGDAGSVFDKIYGLAEQTPPSGPMRRGLALEAHAVEEYMQTPAVATTYRWAFPPKNIRDAQMPFIHASPDGFIYRPALPHVAEWEEAAQRAEFVGEVKCVGLHNYERFSAGHIDPAYLAQVQHYLGVFNHIPAARFVIFNSERWEHFTVDVTRDEDYIEDMRTVAERFWHEHILPARRPRGWPALARQLPVLDKKDVGIRRDDTAFVTAYRRVAEAKLNRALAEEHEKLACAELQALMGDEQIIQCEFGKVTWKEQDSTHLDTTRLFAEHPEISRAEYTVRRVIRVMRVSPRGTGE